MPDEELRRRYLAYLRSPEPCPRSEGARPLRRSQAYRRYLDGIDRRARRPRRPESQRMVPLGDHRAEPFADFQAVEAAGHDDRYRRDIFGMLVIFGVVARLRFEGKALEIEDKRDINVRVLRLADARGAVDVADLILQLR